MAEISVGERVLETNDEGFLKQPEQWDEEVARALARLEGVEELGENHWKVINYLRRYYLEFGVAPMIRKLCKETGFSLNEIYQLFPTGPAQGACKIAGLPRPLGCI